MLNWLYFLKNNLLVLHFKACEINIYIIKHICKLYVCFNIMLSEYDKFLPETNRNYLYEAVDIKIRKISRF